MKKKKIHWFRYVQTVHIKKKKSLYSRIVHNKMKGNVSLTIKLSLLLE